MNKALWLKILDSTEESKLATLYKDLNDEERAELESVFEEDKKTAEEPDAQEDSEDVEKVAADYYAAGKLFAQGFLDQLSEDSGE